MRTETRRGKYFTRSFEILGLKRVIATCYKSQDVDLFTQKTCEKAVYQIYDGDANGNREVDSRTWIYHPYGDKKYSYENKTRGKGMIPTLKELINKATWSTELCPSTSVEIQ